MMIARFPQYNEAFISSVGYDIISTAPGSRGSQQVDQRWRSLFVVGPNMFEEVWRIIMDNPTSGLRAERNTAKAYFLWPYNIEDVWDRGGECEYGGVR
jgi:hypothetical protein